MVQTTARVKKLGKNFEIIVDMERALKFRKGMINAVDFLGIDKIFSDSKKGNIASEKDVLEAFKTNDIYAVAGKIVKEGEILTTQDYRDDERDKKIKQVVDFLSKNAVDPKTGYPHTESRIKMALEQAHVNLKNTPIESQMKEIIEAISSILPIKLETKRIKIVIPAIHTGKSYGLLSQYKEKEEWLPDGSLEVVISVPAGLLMDFYEKLNSITHGSALTEEIKN